jgi:hypothetical protein
MHLTLTDGNFDHASEPVAQPKAASANSAHGVIAAASRNNASASDFMLIGVKM